MYHSIPGNDKLKINRHFDIIPASEADNDIYKNWFKIVDEKEIEFEQYGKVVKRDLKWLYILSLCKLFLPEGYEEYVERYDFPMVDKTDYSNMRSDGNEKRDNTRWPFEIIFKEPVLYKKDNSYRLIAEYPNYALNKYKGVLHVGSSDKIAVNFSETVKERNAYYPAVRLTTNDFHKRIGKAVHRLVAVTWVPNDSWEFKTLINHKDTDKFNYSADNLEWVTPASNIKHAFESGVRDDNIPVKVYDKELKEIKIFHSVTEAFKSFGTRPRSGIESLFKLNDGFYIAANRYEIRRVGDTRDFLFKTMTREEIRLMMAKDIILGYETMNLKTKEVFSGTRPKVAEKINCTLAVIPLSCKRKTVINGWIIRDIKEINTPWNIEEYKEVDNKPRKIKLVGQNDKEDVTLDSLRQVSKFLSVDKKTVGRYINTDKILLGYKVLLVEED